MEEVRKLWLRGPTFSCPSKLECWAAIDAVLVTVEAQALYQRACRCTYFCWNELLNPQKARILLQLLLASGETDPAALQQAFDGR